MNKQLQTFKHLSVFLITFFGFVFFATPAHAQMQCDSFEELSADPATKIEQIVCPVVRIINIFLYAAVAVLIIMLLFGGIKLALSFGDPKAFQAATGTWTWAIIGFLIVVGSFTILGVISRIFGWGFDFTSPFTHIYNQIQQMSDDVFLYTPPPSPLNP